MKVLMLGWEFPPHLSGGLGTACEGLSRALTKEGVEVLFVVPHAAPEVADERITLISADDVQPGSGTRDLPLALPPETTAPEDAAEGWSESLRLLRIDSPLQPYQRPADYDTRLASLRARIQESRVLEDAEQARRALAVPQEELLFRGSRLPSADRDVEETLYGDDLAAEVERYARAVAEIARNEEFDVIHAHDWMTYPAALLARSLRGKPLLCHVHSTEYDRSPSRPDPRIVAIEAEGLRGADRVITVSRRGALDLRERYGLGPAKIRVVHNAVDLPRDAATSRPRAGGDPTVLFLGRVTEQKGPGYFLEAARRVQDLLPAARFVMSGSGALLPDMRARATELGLERVSFPGFLGPAEVSATFRMADVYVMPSVSEPFGITPLEAMAHDVPVILSRQSGVSEVVKSTLAVDYWNVDDLADKVLAVLRRPALRQQLVEEGRREVERLRWDEPARRTRGVYEELVA